QVGLVPSVVRLYSLDSCPCVVTDSPRSVVPGGSFSFVAGGDGEGREAGLPFGPASVLDDQLVSQVVERRPQVVREFARHDAPAQRRLPSDVQADAALPLVAPYIEADSRGIRLVLRSEEPL